MVQARVDPKSSVGLLPLSTVASRNLELTPAIELCSVQNSRTNSPAAFSCANADRLSNDGYDLDPIISAVDQLEEYDLGSGKPLL